jgi:hypothetical protein
MRIATLTKPGISEIPGFLLLTNDLEMLYTFTLALTNLKNHSIFDQKVDSQVNICCKLANNR